MIHTQYTHTTALVSQTRERVLYRLCTTHDCTTAEVQLSHIGTSGLLYREIMPTNNNAKGDTKFYNLVAFFVPRICWCLGIASVYKRLVYPFLYFDLQSGNGDLISLVIYYFHSRLKSAVIFIGFFMGFITFWRIGLSVHRRFIQRAKIVSQYGKWAIITG